MATAEEILLVVKPYLNPDATNHGVGMGFGSPVTITDDTPAQQIRLGKINCEPTVSVHGNKDNQYNCNRCGNDGYYCQPVLKDDVLEFALNIYDPMSEDISLPEAAWWDRIPYYIKAWAIPSNTYNEEADKIELKNLDGDFIAYSAYDNNTGRSYQAIKITADGLYQKLFNAFENCKDACSFYLRFDYAPYAFTSDEQFNTIKKSYYSEHYCLYGCFEKRIPIEGTLTRCEFGIGIFDETPVVHVSFVLGGITYQADINYAAWGLSPSSSSFAYILNIYFDDKVIFLIYGGVLVALSALGGVTDFYFNTTELTAMNDCPEVGVLDDENLLHYCHLTISKERFDKIFIDGTFAGMVHIQEESVSYDIDFAGSPQNIGDVIQSIISIILGNPFDNSMVTCIIKDNGDVIITFVNYGEKLSYIEFTDDDPLINERINANCYQLSVPANVIECCYGDCQPTVLLEGVYNYTDCFNQHYKSPSEYGAFTGDDFNFQLLQRVYGKVTLTGHSIEQTRDDNGRVTGTKKWYVYELKGGNIPEYVANQLALICAAPVVKVDGLELTYDGSGITKDNDYSSMWKLNIKFRSLVCYMKFNC